MVLSYTNRVQEMTIYLDNSCSYVAVADCFAGLRIGNNIRVYRS